MATPSSAVVQDQPTVRKWSPDDLVVAAFAFLGVAGAVFVPIRLHVPPILISFLMATGLASLAYRYLGGIPGTSIVIGTLKLGGALAALVGIAVLINNYVSRQVQFQLVTDDDIVGPWKWVYARGAASGHIYISRDHSGNLVVDGEQDKYTTEDSHVPLYTLKNGKAKLLNRNSLTLEVDVEDHVNKDHFHWKADAPLVLLPAFRGSMRATREDGSVITDTWGITFYKQSGD